MLKVHINNTKHITIANIYIPRRDNTSTHYKTADTDILHCTHYITNIPHSVLTRDVDAHSTLWYLYNDDHKKITNSRYNSLVSHFDKYNILYQNQFGFRQGHSSHHALITLVNKITQLLDSGDMVIGIFLDLKKAFVTVNHKILVKKLYSYGIRGQLINWFKSYLENRSQYVIYNEKRSDIRVVICGVPQGSILGPLLFLFILTILLLSQTNCIMFSLQTTQMFSFREII